jgi:ferredoxin-NADP reductase
MIFTATLQRKEHLQQHITRFRFAMPHGVQLEFDPGQYLMAEVGDIRRRPYSIESTSEDMSEFSLLIDTSPQGIGSKYFESLEVGMTIPMQGPFGLYILQPADSYLFISAGVGIAVFMPMLSALLKSKFPYDIRFVQGAQTIDDLLNKEELHELESKVPKFKWIKSLSREYSTGTFNGRTSEWISRNYEPAVGELVYLCGSPEMVRDCKAILIQKGVDPKQLKIEVFS